jgi:hypothetical protein
MQESFHSLIQSSEQSIRRAFATAEARITQIPSASFDKKSLGSMIVSAATLAAADPIARADAISSDLMRDVNKSIDKVRSIKSECEDLQKAAMYLLGETSFINEIKDFDIAQAAKTLRDGHLSGSTDAHIVAKKINYMLAEVSEELTRLEKRWIPMSLSAARIVCQKASLVSYQKAGNEAMIKKAELRMVRLKGLHNWSYGDTPKKRNKS